MTANFFDSTCNEQELTHELFGVCDDQNGNKAYTDIDNNAKWIATVSNEAQINIEFIAIDNCIKIFKN